MRAFTSIVIIIVVLFVGWWYFVVNGGQWNTPQHPDSGSIIFATTSPTTGNVPTTATSTDAATSTNEIDIAMNAFNYGFDPSTVTVPKGAHVVITLTDTGGLQDFVIDELNLKTPRLEAGATTSIAFDATQAGTFHYYSSVGNHRAMGMWGTLIVTP
ncbi:MAG: cupredoxin domain-containing protein [Patescibacteria group bacterium]|nr:cupredoxin domain-containing protein [Patescibacteria group bacterium]